MKSPSDFEIPLRRHDVTSYGQKAIADIVRAGQNDVTRFLEISLAWNFRPALDPVRLNDALLATIVANPELACAYPYDAHGELVAKRLPASAFEVCVHDCRAMDKQAALQVIRQRSEIGFDTAKGPLLRLDLFRLEDGSSTILLQLSHLVVDGWGTELVANAILQNYMGIAQENAANRRLTYEDFVDWEEEQVSGLKGRQSLDFWRSRLKNFGPKLPLPENDDRDTPAPNSADKCAFALDAEQTASLRHAARACGVSTYTFLLSAFATALGRLTGHSTIPLRSNSANRTRPGFAAIIGSLSQSNALILHMRNDETFAVNVANAAMEVETALEHQYAFWCAYHEFVRNNREMIDGALDQFHFQRWSVDSNFLAPLASMLYDSNASPRRFGDTLLMPVALDRSRAYRDITTGYFESAGTIVVETLYKTQAVSRRVADRLMNDYRNILMSAAANPHIKFSAMCEEAMHFDED